MFVYKIAHKSYSSELSASGLNGRWNGNGKKVIYCAASIALAFLENMIRRQGVGFNSDFKVMVVEIPDGLSIQTINAIELGPGWRDFRNYSKCQPLGDDWYVQGKHPILKVPSAVLTDSSNYVLNAVHPDFSKIRLVETTDLVPDERIERILKGYHPPEITSA